MWGYLCCPSTLLDSHTMHLGRTGTCFTDQVSPQNHTHAFCLLSVGIIIINHQAWLSCLSCHQRLLTQKYMLHPFALLLPETNEVLKLTPKQSCDLVTSVYKQMLPIFFSSVRHWDRAWPPHIVFIPSCHPFWQQTRACVWQFQSQTLELRGHLRLKHYVQVWRPRSQRKARHGSTCLKPVSLQQDERQKQEPVEACGLWASFKQWNLSCPDFQKHAVVHPRMKLRTRTFTLTHTQIHQEH